MSKLGTSSVGPLSVTTGAASGSHVETTPTRVKRLVKPAGTTTLKRRTSLWVRRPTALIFTISSRHNGGSPGGNALVKVGGAHPKQRAPKSRLPPDKGNTLPLDTCPHSSNSSLVLSHERLGRHFRLLPGLCVLRTALRNARPLPVRPPTRHSLEVMYSGAFPGLRGTASS